MVFTLKCVFSNDKMVFFQVEAKINQMKALHEADLLRENERKRSLEGKWSFFQNMFRRTLNEISKLRTGGSSICPCGNQINRL